MIFLEKIVFLFLNLESLKNRKQHFYVTFFRECLNNDIDDSFLILSLINIKINFHHRLPTKNIFTTISDRETRRLDRLDSDLCKWVVSGIKSYILDVFKKIIF